MYVFEMYADQAIKVHFFRKHFKKKESKEDIEKEKTVYEFYKCESVNRICGTTRTSSSSGDCEKNSSFVINGYYSDHNTSKRLGEWIDEI